MLTRKSLTGGALAACLAAAGIAAGLATPGAHGAPACSGADSVSAGVKKREAALRCLLDAERAERRLPKLTWRPTLGRGGRRSNNLMLRCADFSHSPCGESPATTVRRSGYRGRYAGENIAWGSGRLGSARSTFAAWMDSDGHRENMLDPGAKGVGVAVKGPTLFQGTRGASIWTLQIGRR